MKIFFKPEIFEKFHNGFERKTAPDRIIVHGTGGGQSAQALFNWILGPEFERAQAYKNGEGFPFLIDRNGDIYQLQDPATTWAYHSSTGRMDQKTIGIETVNPDPGNNAEYTDSQIESLAGLILMLMDQFGIKHITGHGQYKKEITGHGKQCPGPLFPWEQIEDAITDAGYRCELKSESISIIGA
jgi:hypothetical protein